LHLPSAHWAENLTSNRLNTNRAWRRLR
jgi:hypothetical protein